MFTYNVSVIEAMRILILSCRSSDGWLLTIASVNSFLTYVSEFWYIGSTYDRSLITK